MELLHFGFDASIALQSILERVDRLAILLGG
jgi:hypothetical protein